MVKFVQTKKNRALLLFLIVTFPFLFGIVYLIGFNQVQAAITLDTKSQSSRAGAAGVSWQHTVTDHPDRILIVGVTTLSVGATPPSKVTFNGLQLTRVVSGNCAQGLLCNASLWYLVNPPVGTYTVNVTNGGSISGANGGSVSYYNINTQQPFSKTAVSSGTQNTSNITTNVTVPGVVASDVVVDAMAAGWSCGTTATITPGAGQTQHWKVYDNLENCLASAGSSKTGLSGSTTMTWNIKKSDSDTISWGAAAAVLSLPLPTPTSTQNPTGALTPTSTQTLTPTSTQNPTGTINPTSTLTPTAIPPVGNIINLNFGISNSSPWMQVTCGDIRIDSGVNNPLPSGKTTLTTSAACTEPGIIYTGETNPSFGQGQASSSNQIVGGSAYPELYSSPGMGGLFSSYDSMVGKTQMSGTLPTDLATICTLSNCTLPPNLPHGAYIAHSSVTFNAYSFPANQNYVFLIDGDLTVNGNLVAQAGTNSLLFITTSGNIIIPPNVGSPVGVNTANLAGIFSTDKYFILQSTNNCTDLTLNIEGSIIVNAALNGGSLQNNRDLCGSNAISPTLSITQRLDFVLNLPDFIRDQSTTSQEVVP